ncbi:hypothetical protein HELRODRAFT_192865 [Helobdella robusta]|uniref:Uncharacterized protein n=1 Tax=Helobdella robusta TaxID=6412 RepID=T1FUD6_HELRO|nr:hypothetical protein HELRODRAFT_192865 [Helobdella robusta]ESN99597.1 hypothetical protein HELRODRAFT_192865 [Helobdella robusta]
MGQCCSNCCNENRKCCKRENSNCCKKDSSSNNSCCRNRKRCCNNNKRCCESNSNSRASLQPNYGRRQSMEEPVPFDASEAITTSLRYHSDIPIFTNKSVLVDYQKRTDGDTANVASVGAGGAVYKK